MNNYLIKKKNGINYRNTRNNIMCADGEYPINVTKESRKNCELHL